MSTRKLNTQQAAFVREYLLCRNASEAARKAGYTMKNANRAGTRLLSNHVIKQIIEESEKKAEKKFDISQERIINELASIAFFDIKKVMHINESGVSLKPWSEIEDEISKAIQSVSENESQFGTSRSIRGHDKIAALKLLGLHIGMWKDKGGDEKNPASIILNYNFNDPIKSEEK